MYRDEARHRDEINMYNEYFWYRMIVANRFSGSRAIRTRERRGDEFSVSPAAGKFHPERFLIFRGITDVMIWAFASIQEELNRQICFAKEGREGCRDGR